jgi:acetyl-CoA carboxylase biotin carboxyl carrier protein
MDRERIVNLIEVLQASTAMELAVKEGDSYVRVRRFSAPPAPLCTTPGAAPLANGNGVAAAPAATTVPVTARLVGFFHPGQGPEGPPLVEVGDRVQQGQTVATIESLRQITAVTAPVSGMVVEIVAEPRQPVQFGDVLILLQPSEE